MNETAASGIMQQLVAFKSFRRDFTKVMDTLFPYVM